MKEQHDVIIIGAGIIGASIARELSQYRLSVCVLEKEEEPAFGVSKSNSGIIHPGTQNPVGSLKARLCVQGNQLTRRIARELDVDFKEVGELIVAFSEEEMFRLHKLHDDALALKIPGVKFVDRLWLRKNEPNLNPKVMAALYAPSAGIISPYRMVYALAENARENGVAMHTSARVTRIQKADGGFVIGTDRDEFAGRFVVNCAGLFADEVSRMAGVGDFTVVPVKGEEFILDKKRENLTNHLVFPMPSKGTKGILVIKTADGNPMIGPSAEEAADKYDLATTDEGLAAVIAGAQKLVPSINGDDIIAYFAGLRPAAGEDFIIRHEERPPRLPLPGWSAKL